jgi:hypothetical protein
MLAGQLREVPGWACSAFARKELPRLAAGFRGSNCAPMVSDYRRMPGLGEPPHCSLPVWWRKGSRACSCRADTEPHIDRVSIIADREATVLDDHHPDGLHGVKTVPAVEQDRAFKLVAP